MFDRGRDNRRLVNLLRGIATAADDLFTSLNIEPEDRINATVLVREEFERRMPEFTRVAAVWALLPAIESRLSTYYRKWPQLNSDEADDLAAAVVLKIIESLSGRWPRRNIGAWTYEIARREGALLLRKREIAMRAIGRRFAERDLDSQPCRHSASEAAARMLLDLPYEVQQIYERLQWGSDWEEIKGELRVTEADVSDLLQGDPRPLSLPRPRRKKASARR